MKFTDLPTTQQKELHQTLTNFTQELGGTNFLLQLIEDNKKEKDSPLLSKEKHFSFSKGFVQWNKAIYPETLNLLFTAILREDREGDLLAGLKEKEKKRVENMLKTLAPVSLTIKPKNTKDGEGFSIPIILKDHTPSPISLAFKALFFYNVHFAKSALSFKESHPE